MKTEFTLTDASNIREFGTLISEEYTQEGIEVEAYVPKEIYDKL